MSNRVITFIITGPDNDFHSRISMMNNLKKMGNPVLLHSTEQLETILQNMNGNFEFKLLIHGDEQKGDEFKGKFYIDELNVFLNINEYDIISAKNIGDSTVKKLEDYKGNKGFTRHSYDVINTPNFISSLKTHKLCEVLINENKEANSQSNNTPLNLSKSKFAISTALVQDEYNVCKQMMDGDSTSIPFTGKFKKNNNYEFNENIDLYTQDDKMGMVESAVLVNNIIKSNQYELILLGGVCGGRKGKVHLYDVIIPNQVIDIITGKFEVEKETTSDIYKPYGYLTQTNEDIIAHIKKVVDTSAFKTKLINCIPDGEYTELARIKEILAKPHFKIHTDVMACGPFVLKKEGFLEKKANEVNEKIIAYEMESYGFMRSCIKNNISSLVVKTVMDYTNHKKSDTSVLDNNSTNDDDNIPNGENIKKIASYISFICIKALLPYVEEFLNKKKL